MDCIDVKGGEVFAMLMGCHELRKIEARADVVGGDSFLAIQWGLGKVNIIGSWWTG